MGAAPSRETHSRGLFLVDQSNIAAWSKKQQIVLIPLTKEFFPSPDCPLFVQFHKVRCDAAVNYYFRRPGNPGDLSRIPNYAESYLPNNTASATSDGVHTCELESTEHRTGNTNITTMTRAPHAQTGNDERSNTNHNNDTTKAAYEQCDQVCMNAGTASLVANEFCANVGVVGANEVSGCDDVYGKLPNSASISNPVQAALPGRSSNTAHDEACAKATHEYGFALSHEDQSYPSREALYRGVIERVEESLFDTDAEMCAAYAQLQGSASAASSSSRKKVLPVLCAVAFSLNPRKLPAASLARLPASFLAQMAGTPTHNAGGDYASSNASTNRPQHYASSHSHNQSGSNTHVNVNISNHNYMSLNSSSSINNSATNCANTNIKAGAANRCSMDVTHAPEVRVAGSVHDDGEQSRSQIQLDNSIYAFGAVLNVIGCFGFVSMEEDVARWSRACNEAAAAREMRENSTFARTSYNNSRNNNDNTNNTGVHPLDTSILRSMGHAPVAREDAEQRSHRSTRSPSHSHGYHPPIPGTTSTQYRNNPYSFESSRTSSFALSEAAVSELAMTIRTPTATGYERWVGLPPPVAAPLAAMVYLTKSAGEQNLSRITYVAAATYYQQLLRAGVITRFTGGATVPAASACAFHGHQNYLVHTMSHNYPNTFDTNTALAGIVSSNANNYPMHTNSSYNNYYGYNRNSTSLPCTNSLPMSPVGAACAQIPPPPQYSGEWASSSGAAIPPAVMPVSPSPPPPLSHLFGTRLPDTPVTNAMLSASFPAAFPPHTLPPMEMFSFSSLMTNIPILSFVYEMKCRWGYLSVLRHIGTPAAPTPHRSDTAPHHDTNTEDTTYCSTHATDSPGHHVDPHRAANAMYYQQQEQHIVHHGAPGSLPGSLGHDGLGCNIDATYAPPAPPPALPSLSSSSSAACDLPCSSSHHRSMGGLVGMNGCTGPGASDEMEMWITMDAMLHGRVCRDLAERLCWSLAERPGVMQQDIGPLPSIEAGYWRFRGLVDRYHPPPLPTTEVMAASQAKAMHSNHMCENAASYAKTSEVEEDALDWSKDVYVMGSDVIYGFDEGDILRFDAVRGVWLADNSIPLEGVVLAAMRPYCRIAREAAADDAGWVTKLVHAHTLADEAALLGCHECESQSMTKTTLNTSRYALMESEPVHGAGDSNHATAQDDNDGTSDRNNDNNSDDADARQRAEGNNDECGANDARVPTVAKPALSLSHATPYTLPTPPPTPEQAARMRRDPSLCLVHERVGNFYVYRFELNGTMYYHGTSPDFANPNKRPRVQGSEGKGRASVKMLQNQLGIPVMATALNATNDCNNNNNSNDVASTKTAGDRARIDDAAERAHVEDEASDVHATRSFAVVAAKCSEHAVHASSTVADGGVSSATHLLPCSAVNSDTQASNTVSPNTSPSRTFATASHTSSAAAAAEKPRIAIPYSIASALFSLLPMHTTPARTTHDTNTESVNAIRPAVSSTSSSMATCPETATGNGIAASHADDSAPAPKGAPAATSTEGMPSRPDAPSYLTSRVTSAALQSARRLVQSAYGYAYGAASPGMRRRSTSSSASARAITATQASLLSLSGGRNDGLASHCEASRVRAPSCAYPRPPRPPAFSAAFSSSPSSPSAAVAAAPASAMSATTAGPFFSHVPYSGHFHSVTANNNTTHVRTSSGGSGSNGAITVSDKTSGVTSTAALVATSAADSRNMKTMGRVNTEATYTSLPPLPVYYKSSPCDAHEPILHGNNNGGSSWGTHPSPNGLRAAPYSANVDEEPPQYDVNDALGRMTRTPMPGQRLTPNITHEPV